MFRIVDSHCKKRLERIPLKTDAAANLGLTLATQSLVGLLAHTQPLQNPEATCGALPLN